MKLSAPIFLLKQKAKQVRRSQNLPLSKALDVIAREEGFQTWSHLAKASVDTTARDLFHQLAPGDLLLLGARPGQGKTLLSLQLLLEAIKAGYSGHFFTLEYHSGDVAEQLSTLGQPPHLLEPNLIVDTSDDIAAAYVLERLQQANKPAFVVIDYLQLLDQRRSNPPINQQLESLKDFARTCGAIILALSQIDRSFDLSAEELPDSTFVRQPNQIDFNHFSKTCFLHNGKSRLNSSA